MTFNRPTPKQINDRLIAGFDAYLPGSDARLRQSVENIIVRVVSMASHEMYGYLDFISRQILVSTAEDAFLEMHGSEWGIDRRAATAATGHVQFTGTDGTVIYADSAVQTANGVEYLTDADITIAGGVGSGTVTASVAGADGDAAIGAVLTLTSPVAGAVSAAAVIDDGSGQGLTGGADIEDDDAYRARIIERQQEPPQGGASYDYEAWAKEVSGVTRAWVYPLQLGLGTVVVLFVMDGKVDTILPSVDEVAAVQAHIDAVRPVTAEVTVVAPTQRVIPFDISLSPNTAAIQSAVEAEIKDFIAREATPGAVLYLSRINEAISAAAGEFDHVLNSPNENQILDFGEMAVAGDFTWSDA